MNKKIIDNEVIGIIETISNKGKASKESLLNFFSETFMEYKDFEKFYAISTSFVGEEGFKKLLEYNKSFITIGLNNYNAEIDEYMMKYHILEYIRG